MDDASDAPDANPGDGLCIATTGDCTLRAAMAEADLADPGGDVPEVTIAPGIDPTLDPALGSLPADRVRIIGAPGADPTTVDAEGGPGVLTHCDGDLVVEDLTITGAGVAIGSACPEDDPSGRIEVTRVTLTDNGIGETGVTGVTGDSYTGNLILAVHDSDLSGNTGSTIDQDFTQVVVTSSTIAAVEQ